MDLLSALPEVIQTEIFKYLDLKSILTATRVCHSWNYNIGKSKACMNRVALVCRQNNINGGLNAIMNSVRDYQKIRMYFRPNSNQQIDSIMRSVLKKFSKSIIIIESTNDLLRVCDLPKLKELRLIDHFYKFHRYSYFLYAHGLVMNLTSITSLTVKSIYMDEKSSRVLDKALKEMSNLKSLTVNHINFLKNFKTGDYNFKLEEFFYYEYRYPIPAMDLLFEFLLSNSSTLKTIRCDPVTFDGAVLFMSNFPHLTTFQFHGLSVFTNNHDNFEVKNFPVNHSIKRLVVGLYYFRNHTKQNFVNLMSSMKNLQELKAYILFSELIDVIFACPTIKVVRFAHLSDNVTETQKNLMISNQAIRFVGSESLQL